MMIFNQYNSMIRKNLFVTILVVLVLSNVCYAREGMSVKDFLEEALPTQTGRKIVLDRTTGILTVTDTPSNHKLIRRLIQEFDIGPTQVMIEARFVEVGVSDLDEFGIEWYWYRAGGPGMAPAFSDLTVGNSWQYLDPNNRRSADNVNWTISDPEFGEAGECFPATAYGADFYIGKTSFTGDYLRGNLHALEQRGKANTLSAPKVMTLAGQMATMESTTTFPYVSKVELENLGTADDPIWNIKTTIEEKTVGISLEVTPHVGSGSKFITLDIHPVVDELIDQKSIRPSVTTTYYWNTGEGVMLVNATVPGIPDTVGWPTIETRSTQTTVVARSGRTIILGGLIKENEKITNKKIPFLGNIPLLGKLFRYKHVDRNKQKLLIFITATLISPEGEEIK